LRRVQEAASAKLNGLFKEKEKCSLKVGKSNLLTTAGAKASVVYCFTLSCKPEKLLYLYLKSVFFKKTKEIKNLFTHDYKFK